MISANFSPQHLFSDITLREQAPPCDLYIAGWPCQGNSSLGKRQGFADERSQVFWSVLAYIRQHSPRLVLLENVQNLLRINGGEDFETVRRQLSQLEYNIHWKVLNTKDYGVPQNRPRLFLVCIRKDIDLHTFSWPEPLPKKKHR